MASQNAILGRLKLLANFIPDSIKKKFPIIDLGLTIAQADPGQLEQMTKDPLSVQEFGTDFMMKLNVSLARTDPELVKLLGLYLTHAPITYEKFIKLPEMQIFIDKRIKKVN